MRDWISARKKNKEGGCDATCEDFDPGRVVRSPFFPFGQRDLRAHLSVRLCDKRLSHMDTTAQRCAVDTPAQQINTFLPVFVRLAAREHGRVHMSVYVQGQVPLRIVLTSQNHVLRIKKL